MSDLELPAEILLASSHSFSFWFFSLSTLSSLGSFTPKSLAKSLLVSSPSSSSASPRPVASQASSCKLPQSMFWYSKAVCLSIFPEQPTCVSLTFWTQNLLSWWHFLARMVPACTLLHSSSLPHLATASWVVSHFCFTPSAFTKLSFSTYSLYLSPQVLSLRTHRNSSLRFFSKEPGPDFMACW